ADFKVMHNFFSFLGGSRGEWKVLSIKPVCGKTIESVERVKILNELCESKDQGVKWILSGFVSNVRYANRKEVDELKERSPNLGRPKATCAALIPILKNERWWSLSQDERRKIFEEDSHHTKIGMEYLPGVARRLHHSRDIG